MAIIENNVLGSISGKLGNTVIYKRKGKLVIKGKPVKSSVAPSEKQLYHRAAFKLAQDFLVPMRAELELGFAKPNPAQSQGFNRALSVALKTAVLNEAGSPVLYPEKVKTSEGDLLGVESPQVQWVGGNLLEVSWSPNAFMGHAKESDRLFVVAYDPGMKRKWSVVQGNYRKTGLQQVQFPWSGDLQGKFYIYLSFYAETKGGREFSDSLCLGRV
ncbi:DUF6266 family protein [Algoriphagus sp.]|uniref:DUF6266 family protein n=1 Tax=Algoriphagus sp. TaxID=1872435 RepID=UPI003F6F3369